MIRLLVLLLLVSCGGKPTNLTDTFTLPPELANCQVFRLRTSSFHSNITVIKCSASSTTTRYTTGNNKHRTHHNYAVVNEGN